MSRVFQRDKFIGSYCGDEHQLFFVANMIKLCISYIFIFIFLIYSYNILYAQDFNMNGKVNVYKDNDIQMMIARLTKDNGEEIILGAPGNMSEDARKCIYDAGENNYYVNIRAKYAYDGIDDRTIICKKIDNLKTDNMTIGPEIFGIKIGMTQQDAINNIEKIFNNKNKYTIDTKNINNGNMFYLTLYENYKRQLTILDFRCEGGILNHINIYNNPLTKASPYYLSTYKKLLNGYKFIEHPRGTYSYISAKLRIIINDASIIVSR